MGLKRETEKKSTWSVADAEERHFSREILSLFRAYAFFMPSWVVARGWAFDVVKVEFFYTLTHITSFNVFFFSPNGTFHTDTWYHWDSFGSAKMLRAHFSLIAISFVKRITHENIALLLLYEHWNDIKV